MNKHFQSKLFYSLAILCKNIYFHLPYRQMEDVVLEYTSNRLQSIPHYCNISRRINRLDIKKEEVDDDDDQSNLHNDYFIISIDMSRIKVSNKGEWIRH